MVPTTLLLNLRVVLQVICGVMREKKSVRDHEVCIRCALCISRMLSSYMCNMRSKKGGGPRGSGKHLAGHDAKDNLVCARMCVCVSVCVRT
jgi:hypothetical protein